MPVNTSANGESVCVILRQRWTQDSLFHQNWLQVHRSTATNTVAPEPIPDAARRAEALGYACLGGQFQFRAPA